MTNSKCHTCRFAHILKGSVRAEDDTIEDMETEVESVFCYWATYNVSVHAQPIFVQNIESCNQYKETE